VVIININYLLDNNNKQHLDAMLHSYNLTSLVHFPTRIQNESSTVVDSIFIDTPKINDYTILSIINWLSDHDSQTIIIRDINFQIQNGQIYTIRSIDIYSVSDF
jgi:hypothetical protein